MKFYFSSFSRLFLYRYIWIFLLYGFCSCQNGLKTEVPDLEAKQFKGSLVKLQTLAKGKVTIINLWNTFCGPCLQEMPALHKIYDKYRNNDRVAFVSIALNTEAELNRFNNKPDTANPYYIAFKASQLDSFYLPTLAVYQKGNTTMQVNGSWTARATDSAETNGISRLFNIRGIPATLIYNEAGTMVKKIEGLRTEDYYIQLIDGLLAKS